MVQETSPSWLDAVRSSEVAFENNDIPEARRLLVRARSLTHGLASGAEARVLAAEGRLEQALGRLPEACDVLTRAVALFDEASVGGQELNQADIDRSTAALSLAGSLIAASRPQEARSTLDAMLQGFGTSEENQRAVDGGEASGELVVAVYLRVRLDLLMPEGEHTVGPEVLQTLLACAAAMEKLSDYKLEHVECLADAGQVQVQTGDLEEGRATFLRAQAVMQERLGDDHPLQLGLLNRLATVEETLGQTHEAGVYLRQAAAFADRLFPDDVPAATVRIYLAAFLRRRGELSECDPILREALAIYVEQLPPGDLKTLETRAARAGLKAESGDFEQSAALYAEVLKCAHEYLSPQHAFVAAALVASGTVQLQLRNADAALEFFREALGCYGALFGADHPTVAGALNHVASAHIANGAHQTAKPMLERARDMFEQSLPGSYELASTYDLLAQAEWGMGQSQPARRAASQALALLEAMELGQSDEAAAVRAFIKTLH